MFANHHSRRDTIVRGLAVFLVAVGLLAIGRLTAPRDPAVQVRSGVPVSFGHGIDGARAAALTFASTRARAELLDPARRRQLLGAIATPAFARTADRDDTTEDAAPLSGQQSARYVVTGLGSRVTGWSKDSASLTVWLFQVFTGDAAIGAFSSQDVRLRWSDGRWRLDGQRDSAVQAVPEIFQQPRRDATRAVVAGLQPPSFGRP